MYFFTTVARPIAYNSEIYACLFKFILIKSLLFIYLYFNCLLRPSWIKIQNAHVRFKPMYSIQRYETFWYLQFFFDCLLLFFLSYKKVIKGLSIRTALSILVMRYMLCWTGFSISLIFDEIAGKLPITSFCNSLIICISELIRKLAMTASITHSPYSCRYNAYAEVHAIDVRRVCRDILCKSQ